MSRDRIRFLRDQRVVEIDAVDANQTVLDYLRLTEGAMGTKEGCAEGDCGACTVAVGSAGPDGVDYQPIVSCIHLLGMLDGKQLISVDDLSNDSDDLHPVQAAMLREHGSQCGFCTPGIIMSLFTLYHRTNDAKALDRDAVNDALAGNLCRCTGYRSIVSAATSSCNGSPADRFAHAAPEIRAELVKLNDAEDLFIPAADSNGFFAAPASIKSLLELFAAHPDATVVGGATDVGLWITKSLKRLPKIIHVGRAVGFDRIEIESNQSTYISAGATYEQAFESLAGIDPDLGVVLRRLGSRQVRAAGTIGGNIANGSPIGDMAPMLIALDASLDLQSSDGERRIAIEDFFIDYGKQDLRAGEIVAGVLIPALREEQKFRAFKISKRFDQDISSLLVAVALRLDGHVIREARIAFGGMAATPKRARLTEAALVGINLNDEAAIETAAARLSEDFQPLTDMRASASYRANSARALGCSCAYGDRVRRCRRRHADDATDSNSRVVTLRRGQSWTLRLESNPAPMLSATQLPTNPRTFTSRAGHAM